MTFWNGTQTAFAARFDRLAEKNHQDVLLVERVKEGEIVVAPGFVYRKVPMTGMVMAAHLKAMRTFKHKTIISHERDPAPAVDVGVVNLPRVGSFQ